MTKVTAVNFNLSKSGYPFPSIANVQISDASFVANGSPSISTSGGFAIINGTRLPTSSQVLVGNTFATSVTFVSSDKLHVVMPAKEANTYPIYIVDTSTGRSSIKINSVVYE